MFCNALGNRLFSNSTTKIVQRHAKSVYLWFKSSIIEWYTYLSQIALQIKEVFPDDVSISWYVSVTETLILNNNILIIN